VVPPVSSEGPSSCSEASFRPGASRAVQRVLPRPSDGGPGLIALAAFVVGRRTSYIALAG
jgi:hypothetical protein